MCPKTRKFYVLRVEDHKPLRGQEIAKSLDAGELLYVRDFPGNHVILVGEGQKRYPQDNHSSYTRC